MSSPEVGRTLFQAGLQAVTGITFPLDRAGVPDIDPDRFRQLLIQRAVREKMIPMLASSPDVQALGLGDAPAQLTEVYGIISREQYTHLRPVLDALAGRGIPVILIKGADLDLAVYEKRFPRVMGDIDILVRPPDVPAVIEIFQSQGFVQGTLNRSRLEIIPLTDEEREETEDGSIELAEFSRLISVPDLLPYKDVIDRHLAYWRMMPLHGTYYLVIGYDVHIHLSLDLDLQDVWSNLRSIEFPETGSCLAQSFTDMSWYLAARLYHELHMSNASIMRAFLDVLHIVHRKHDAIDWERISFLAGKYKLHPSFYYVFWHVGEILGGVVPHGFLETLCPLRADSERGHDWGDFVPRMLGEVHVAPILRRSPAP